jgi:hypothetical protein
VLADGQERCAAPAWRYSGRDVRRAAPVFLVLVMLLPQAALASAWYQCHHDRAVRHRCCCPQPAREGTDARPVGPELRRADCCDVIMRQAREQVAHAEWTPSSRVRAQLLVALPAPLPALAAVGPGVAAPAPAVRATAPPAPPDPIYLRHASLLL